MDVDINGLVNNIQTRIDSYRFRMLRYDVTHYKLDKKIMETLTEQYKEIQKLNFELGELKNGRQQQ